MKKERFQSLAEFWPFYLAEHKHPVSRRLHFLGTSGAIAGVAASMVTNPIGMTAALAGMIAVGKKAIEAEGTAPSKKHVAAVFAMPIAASPVFATAAIVWAYGCAWAGHFKFEGNRPATFEYPIMSLASDFRMWFEMAKGRLWAGEDPNGELGVPEPVELADEASGVTPIRAAS